VARRTQYVKPVSRECHSVKFPPLKFTPQPRPPALIRNKRLTRNKNLTPLFDPKTPNPPPVLEKLRAQLVAMKKAAPGGEEQFKTAVSTLLKYLGGSAVFLLT
jgi:hypothetical protein